MTLKSIASSNGFRVIGRVQSEDYDSSELCDLIQEDPEAKIEKFLIAVNGLDSADARKVAETFEEAGVIYATNAGDFAMQLNGYPSQHSDLTHKDKEDVVDSIKQAKRRNGGKPVYAALIDCGIEVCMVFTPYRLTSSNKRKVLARNVVKVLKRNPAMSEKIWTHILKELT
jgi:hypothetical protein